MKNIFLFFFLYFFEQMLFAQINLDASWQSSVVENYKKYDNYTARIITNSTIRGKHTKDRGLIDTLYNTKDTTLIYCETGRFVGVRSKNSISYTENDTNTTIDFARKFVAINSLQDYWGNYFDNIGIRWATHFYTSIIGYSPFFKKIDRISDIGDYFVFECIDSSILEVSNFTQYFLL